MKILLSAVTLFLCLSLLPVSAGEILFKSGETVGFLGDDITEFGGKNTGGFIPLVQDGLKRSKIEVNVITVGVGGTESKDMLAWVKGLIARKPNWIVVNCGVNDMFHKVSAESFESNIRELVGKIRAAGIKPVLIKLTLVREPGSDYDKRTASYQTVLEVVAKELKVPLIDVNTPMRKEYKAGQPGGSLTIDGTRMNGRGNQVLACAILQGIGMDARTVEKYRKIWNNMPGTMSIDTVFSVKEYRQLKEDAGNDPEKIPLVIHGRMLKEHPVK